LLLVGALVVVALVKPAPVGPAEIPEEALAFEEAA
jgi:hypothetical protein